MTNFAVFILTHGRPRFVYTYNALRRHGYTGKIYLLLDNEDEKISTYKAKYGRDKIIVFDKAAIAKKVDVMDNFPGRSASVYVRWAAWDIAKELGLKNFVLLDDDYTWFGYRYKEGSKYMKSLNDVFRIFVEYLNSTPISTICFSQGGDHIGGYDDAIKVRRKAMNSFICSVDKFIPFIGRMNGDVNTYTYLGGLGYIFLTINNVQLAQKPTQITGGGLSEMYMKYGTYIKSFYTVMVKPSSVKISLIGQKNIRIHHNIDWKTTVPNIISERHKK